MLVETDAGVLFTKLRGAAQGVGALVAEVIVAELAESLGLRVPARTLVRFGEHVDSDDPNDELAGLLHASRGLNLGFAYLAGAENFLPAMDVSRVRQDEAAAILWVDGLTANPDRTARNPNLLWWGNDLWLIDHGAALSFQYALPEVDEGAARRPYTLREPHVLDAVVADLRRWDDDFAGRVSWTVVEAAMAAVPDEFLPPLTRAERTMRRSAYVSYLISRLEAPRPFLDRTVVRPNEQPRRGRPSWIARP